MTLRIDVPGEGFVPAPVHVQSGSVPQAADYHSADIDMTCRGRFATIEYYALAGKDGVLKIKDVKTLSGKNDLLVVSFAMHTACEIGPDDYSIMIDGEEATVITQDHPGNYTNFIFGGFTRVGIAYIFQTFDTPPQVQDIDFVFHGPQGLFGPGPSAVGVAIQVLRAHNAENILPPVHARQLGLSNGGKDFKATTGAHQLGTGLHVTTFGRKMQNPTGFDSWDVIFDIFALAIPTIINTVLGVMSAAQQTLTQLGVEALRKFMPNAVSAKTNLISAQTALELGTPNVSSAKASIQSALNGSKTLQGLEARDNMTNALGDLNLDPPDVDSALGELQTGINSLANWIADTQEAIDLYDAGQLDAPPAQQLDSSFGLNSLVFPDSMYYHPLEITPGALNDFEWSQPGQTAKYYGGDPTVPNSIGSYGIDLELHTQWTTSNQAERAMAASWGDDPMRGASVCFPIRKRDVATLPELPAAPDFPQNGPVFVSAEPAVDTSNLLSEVAVFAGAGDMWLRSEVGEIPDVPGTVVIFWLIGGPSQAGHPETVKLLCGDVELTQIAAEPATRGMYAFCFAGEIDSIESHSTLICRGLAIGLAACVIDIYTGVAEIGAVHSTPRTTVERGAAGYYSPFYLNQKILVEADERPKVLAQAFFGPYVNFAGHPNLSDHESEYSQTVRGATSRVIWGSDTRRDGVILVGDAGPYLYEDDKRITFQYYEKHIAPLDTLVGSPAIALELIGEGIAAAPPALPPIGVGQGWLNIGLVASGGPVFQTDFDVTLDEAGSLVMWMFYVYDLGDGGVTVDGDPCEFLATYANGTGWHASGYVIHDLAAGMHSISIDAPYEVVAKVLAYPGMAYHGQPQVAAQTNSTLAQTVESDKLIAQAFLSSTPAVFETPNYSQPPRRTPDSFQGATNIENLGQMAGEAYGPAVFTYTNWPAYADTVGVAVELSPTPWAPSITTTELEAPQAGHVFSQQLVASGSMPLTWSDPDDSLAGSGLTLSSAGVLSGTPAGAGAYNFEFTVINSEGSDTQAYTGIIDAPVILIATTALDPLYVGQAVTQNIAYTGETALSLEIVGFAPDGTTFSIDPTTHAVKFVGTPITVGSYSFTLKVIGTTGYGDRTFTGSVLPAPTVPTITTTDLGAIYADNPFSKEIAYTGSPATSVSVVSGAFPDGIDVGLVFGTVTVAGTATTIGESYTVTLRVTNDVGHDDQVFSGTVAELTDPLVITTTDLGSLEVGIPVSKEIGYIGWHHTLTGLEISAGEPPAGLLPSIDGTFKVSFTGTPIYPGPYSFELHLTNADGEAFQAFEGVVTGSLPVAPEFVTTSLGEVLYNVNQAKVIHYTGSVATGVAIVDGNLPTGMSVSFTYGVITIWSTPEVLGEDYDFTLRITNAAGDVEHRFTGTVTVAVVPDVTTTSLGTVSLGDPYSLDIEYTGSAITSIEITAGSFPSGLDISLDDGVITVTGTPTMVGSYSVTVKFINPVGEDSVVYEGSVVESTAPPTITTAPTLGHVYVGHFFAVQIEYTGAKATSAEIIGDAPITNTHITFISGSGNVFYGGSFDDFAGTAYDFSIRVTNDYGYDEIHFTGVTELPFAPSFGTTSLGNIYAAVPFAKQVFVGGALPRTVSVDSGAFPSGISITGMTDTYITVSGTAITVDEDYDVTLLVENFVGSVTRNFTGTVLPTPVAPEIITTSLGDLQVGVPFDTEVVWTGTTPFTAVDSFFDDLPDGITPYLIGAGLDRFGFHGTPTTAGPYSFTVRVGNVAGYDTQLFSGEIAEGSVAPTITTTDLGDLTEDEAFSLEIEYTGSTATAVSVVSGSLPGGLNVDLTAGVVTVSGTPTTPGAYSFTLRVTNGTGHDDQAFSGTVNATPAGPVITTTDLGYMEVAVPFIKEILYTGEPATGRSDSGEPAGLFSHVNEDGTVFVTGTPTEAGPYSYTITLTNADGSGSKTFEGEVAPEGSPPSFVTTSLGEVGHDYYFLKFISYASGTSLTAAEVISGALPTGLSLNVSPVFIAGTPSVLGEEYDFTLRLTNAGGGFVDHEFTGTVVEATAPTVTTTSLGTLYVGVPFSVEIEYTGSPITSYSLPFDPLPDGFEVDLTDGVVTISGTPVATGGYTFDLRVDNVTSFATQTFSGTIMEVPAARGGFDLALVVGGPLVTNTFADTIVFHAMIIDVVGDPEFDPSTVTLSVDGRTTLTPLVTPVALVTGAPYYAAAYIVHGLEAGIHTISVSANVVIYGTAVSYPGITGHGAVTATPLTDPMLTQEIESTEGTLISQGYSLPALFDPLEYGQTPRYTGLYTMGGEAVAPATFTYDLNGFLALSGMTWEDLATYGYSFTGIAIELTGTPTDSPVITLDVLDPGGNPFFVGRTGYKQIIVSTGADDWSVVSGAFPTGMTFDTDKAVLYGIATTEEEYSVTVRASNANGHVDKTYTGTVHPTPIPEITTTSIAPFTVGGYYSQYFVATNYTVGTYDMGRTWSVSAGALPDGVSLVDYLGQLTGTPTTVGPYSFTIKVESQYGSDEVEFTGTVSA